MNIRTYEKYAKLYGIYHRLLNQSGRGIPKYYITRGTNFIASLESIFAGEHPSYNWKNFQRRLIYSGLLEEKCMKCGMAEKRITDQKAPLMLLPEDGNPRNYARSNLLLICYNCAFLTISSTPFRFEKMAARPLQHDLTELTDEMTSAIREAQEELGEE